MGKLEEHKPSVVVHLGDGHEADAASKWPSEAKHDLAEEFAQHNELLRMIRVATPKAEHIWLPGNHDHNIRAAGRINPKIRELCNFYKLENEFSENRWVVPCEYEYHRLRGVYRIGAVTFAHGYEHGVNADEYHSIILGTPYGLYIGGHTHRPTVGVMRARKTQGVPLPYWYANAGTMRRMDPEYMRRKRVNQWGQALVVGDAEDIRSPRLSKSWDAQVEIFRMAEDI